jgi:HEAT repeat protein
VSSSFRRALRDLHKHDPQRAEDAFGTLAADAGDHAIELIDAFRSETDPGIRRWLLELVGLARSADALPLLVEQLQSDDELLRSHAIDGLKRLNTKPAREALWKARANRHIE